MAANTFGNWLLQELNSREWDQAELARKSGISDAHISRIVSGGRSPGIDSAKRIARALRLPPEDVLRQAGLLPPRHGNAAEDQRTFDDLMATVAALTPTNQRLVFEIVERIKASEILVSR